MKILILGGNGMIGHKMYQVISKKYPNTWVLFKKNMIQYKIIYYSKKILLLMTSMLVISQSLYNY